MIFVPLLEVLEACLPSVASPASLSLNHPLQRGRGCLLGVFSKRKEEERERERERERGGGGREGEKVKERQRYVRSSSSGVCCDMLQPNHTADSASYAPLNSPQSYDISHTHTHRVKTYLSHTHGMHARANT